MSMLRKKIFKIAENDYLVKVKRMELVEPSMEYTNDVQFVEPYIDVLTT